MGDVYIFETLDYKGKTWVDAEKHIEIVTRLQKAEAELTRLRREVRILIDHGQVTATLAELTQENPDE